MIYQGTEIKYVNAYAKTHNVSLISNSVELNVCVCLCVCVKESQKYDDWNILSHNTF